MSESDDEAPTLVLVASPFLGAACWHPVESVLRAAGHRVVSTPGRLPPVVRDPEVVLESIVVAIPDSDVVLALHSNAGLYAASIAERCSVRGIVFVDAGIPVQEGSQPIAPERLLSRLRPLARNDGTLPPWDEWFDDADIAELFPDPLTRERVTTGLPAVSLSYLESRLTIRSGWMNEIRAAYLAFGETYAEEIERARALGWPTTVLEGRHLHLLVDPDVVAAELLALI